MGNSYPNQIYTAFSFLGFIMCMIPIPWHIRAWNSGTLLYMFWVGIGCLVLCVNSIIWNDNAVNWSPIWCDITSRFIMGGNIGVLSSSLCIIRRLYLLQKDPAKNAAVTKSEKLRMIMVDLSIGLGLPSLHMGLFYIVQGHRFNILEGIGCWQSIYLSWVSIVVYNLPTLLVGLVSGSYAIRTVYSINRRRTQFKRLLSAHLNVTSGLYIRLMALAGVEALCTVPLVTFFIFYNMKTIGLRPWKSWENTHSHFNRVEQFPAIVWRPAPGGWGIDLTRWLFVVCAFTFFGFFGFAEEAILHYRLAFRFVLEHFGVRVGRRTDLLTFHTAPFAASTNFDIPHRKRRHIDSISTTQGLEINGIDHQATDTHSSISEARDVFDRSKNDIEVAMFSDMTPSIALPPTAFISDSAHLAIDLSTAAIDSFQVLTPANVDATSARPSPKQGT